MVDPRRLDILWIGYFLRWVHFMVGNYISIKLLKTSLFFFFFFFGCVGSPLLHAGFLQLWRAGATLRCGARASHCSGFSRCGAWALGTRVSVVVARGL